MAEWRNDYISALKERDKYEKANFEIYSAYTKLADRAATLGPTGALKTEVGKDFSTLSPTAKSRATGSPQVPSPVPAVQNEVTTRLRQDLSEAQRSKGQLQTQLKTITDELEKLKTRSKMDMKRIDELNAEKASLVIKTRDRDEELKGKAKLLEDLHDETVSLTLELNMAEERSNKLQAENKELVDRWMARKGQEADAMNALNNASKFS